MKTNRRDFLAISLSLVSLPIIQTKEITKEDLERGLNEHYSIFEESSDEDRKFFLDGWKNLVKKFEKENRQGAASFGENVIKNLETIARQNGGQVL